MRLCTLVTGLVAVTTLPLPLVLAARCTADDSSPWPYLPPSQSGGATTSSSSRPPGSTSAVGSGGSSVGSSSSCSQFSSDSDAYQACAELERKGRCNAVGGDACDTDDDRRSNTDDLISGGGDDLISFGSDSGLIKRAQLLARADLDCSKDEQCYQRSDDSLVCFNPTTSKCCASCERGEAKQHETDMRRRFSRRCRWSRKPGRWHVYGQRDQERRLEPGESVWRVDGSAGWWSAWLCGHYHGMRCC